MRVFHTEEYAKNLYKYWLNDTNVRKGKYMAEQDMRAELGIDPSPAGKGEVKIPVHNQEFGHDFRAMRNAEWLNAHRDSLQAELSQINQQLGINEQGEQTQDAQLAEMRNGAQSDKLRRRKEWLEKILRGEGNALDKLRIGLKDSFAKAGKLPSLGEMARAMNPMDRLRGAWNGLKERVNKFRGREATPAQSSAAETTTARSNAAEAELAQLQAELNEIQANRAYSGPEALSQSRRIEEIQSRMDTLFTTEEEATQPAETPEAVESQEVTQVAERPTVKQTRKRAERMSKDIGRKLERHEAVIDRVLEESEDLEKTTEIIVTLEESAAVMQEHKMELDRLIVELVGATTEEEQQAAAEKLEAKLQELSVDYSPSSRNRVMDVVHALTTEAGRIKDIPELLKNYWGSGGDISAGITIGQFITRALVGSGGAIAGGLSGGAWQLARTEWQLHRTMTAPEQADERALAQARLAELQAELDQLSANRTYDGVDAYNQGNRITELNAEIAALNEQLAQSESSADQDTPLSFAERVFSQDSRAARAREQKIAEADYLKASEKKNRAMQALITALSAGLNFLGSVNKAMIRVVEGVDRNRGGIQRRLEKANVSLTEPNFDAWVDMNLNKIDSGMDQGELAKHVREAQSLLMDLLRARRDAAIKTHAAGSERFGFIARLGHKYDKELFGDTARLDAMINSLAQSVQAVDLSPSHLRELMGQDADPKLQRAIESLNNLLANPVQALDGDSVESVHRMGVTQFVGTVAQGIAIEGMVSLAEQLGGRDAAPVTAEAAPDSDVNAPDFTAPAPETNTVTATPSFESPTGADRIPGPSIQNVTESNSTNFPDFTRPLTENTSAGAASSALKDRLTGVNAQQLQNMKEGAGGFGQVLVEQSGVTRLVTDPTVDGSVFALNQLGFNNLSELYNSELSQVALAQSADFPRGAAINALSRLAQEAGWTLSDQEVQSVVSAIAPNGANAELRDSLIRLAGVQGQERTDLANQIINTLGIARRSNS